MGNILMMIKFILGGLTIAALLYLICYLNRYFRDKKIRPELIALKESEDWYRKLLELSPFAVLVQSEGRCIFVNSTGMEMLGAVSSDEVLGKNVCDLIEIADTEPGRFLREHLMDGTDFEKDLELKRVEAKIFRPDREVTHIIITATSFVNQGRPAIQIIARDITDRKMVIDALKESEERYRTLFEKTASPALVIDTEGNYVDCNQSALDFLECAREELLTKRVGDFDPEPISQEEKEIIVKEHKKLWKTGGSSEVQYKVKGKIKILELTISPIVYLGQQVVIGIGKDITERKQAEAKIRHMAYHDNLTGLPNRVLFADRLRLAVAQSHRKSCSLAVMFLDLDFFKTINDTFGHSAGDRLLQKIAERLKGCVREVDTLARPGGDEFTILLPEINKVDDALVVADRILEALKEPWNYDGMDFYITTSIGIAVYPEDGEDAETLLRNADTAMYRAKEQGRNVYQLYTPAMNEQAVARIRKENSLRLALEKQEFVLHYQPQYNIITGRIIGMEALVRWLHPELGLVGPMEFIPLAEETGLIVPLGEWVLRTACSQNKAWQDAGLPKVRVAVNISARQFHQQNFLETVETVLVETGLAPAYLELEITESMAMKKLDYTTDMVTRLKKIGVHISIDDFGTGYSSLSYLKNFPPIDRLKIDRSFVQDITANLDKPVAVLVSTMIALARNLEIDVIAEGVETEEQMHFLKEQRCDKIQGYLFSKPLPTEELTALLKREKSA